MHEGAAHVTDLAEKYGAAGAEVFGVSVDSPYALKAFKRDEDLEARFLSDFHPKGKVADGTGLHPRGGVATRATYVIDKDGKVA